MLLFPNRLPTHFDKINEKDDTVHVYNPGSLVVLRDQEKSRPNFCLPNSLEGWDKGLQ